MAPTPHGCILRPGFVEPEPAKALLAQLIAEVEWTTHMRSRHTASMGVPYNYAGASYPVAPWHPAVRALADQVSAHFGHPITNALLNYYPTGRQRIGWHHDDTEILAEGTGVSIVSLGVERVLKLRAAVGEGFVYEDLSLPAGSLLFMPSAMQGEWLHSMRRADTELPRVSVSFRQIVTWPDQPPVVPDRRSG